MVILPRLAYVGFTGPGGKGPGFGAGDDELAA